MAISAPARKLAVILWNMVVKKIPCKPPTKYLFLDEKRKLKPVARIKKQIAKFDLTKEDFEFVTSRFSQQIKNVSQKAKNRKLQCRMAKITDIYYPTGEIEKTFINSIWRLTEYDFHERKEIILPKGTVEIIFNSSETINYFNPSLQVSKKLPTVFVNGINFKPFELMKTGRQEFIGIQLNSIGLRLLFNISAKEFNNCVCEGENICSYLNTLADELFCKQTFSQQVEIILIWIRKKIPTFNYQYSICRVQKLRSLTHSDNITVKKLSSEVCLSDRQLRRFSQDWLGMNTEEFILYNKYLNCLHLLHNSKQTLTEIGLEAGYYDQSHFIREFKSFTDLTPKQYREANTDLPGHIFL